MSKSKVLEKLYGENLTPEIPTFETLALRISFLRPYFQGSLCPILCS